MSARRLHEGHERELRTIGDQPSNTSRAEEVLRSLRFSSEWFCFVFFAIFVVNPMPPHHA